MRLTKYILAVTALAALVVMMARPSAAARSGATPAMQADKESIPPEGMAEREPAGTFIPALPPPPDGTLKIHESTLNEMAAALPLEKGGGFPVYKRVEVCLPLVGCAGKTIKVCDATYTARLEDVGFHILSDETTDGPNIYITGKVRGSFHCIITFGLNSPVSGTADVTYNSSQKRFQVRTDPTTIPVCVVIPDSVPFIGGDTKCLDYRVDLSKPFTYNIPVGTTLFHFESADGPRAVRLTPKNLNLTKHNDFIMLQGDVVLW